MDIKFNRKKRRNIPSGLTQQPAESEDVEELSGHGIALSAVYDSVIRGRAAQAAHHVAHLCGIKYFLKWKGRRAQR